MIMESSDQPRWKKKYACPYCHKQFCKLPRHIETIHSKVVDVHKLKASAKGSTERQQILKIMRNKGSFVHNTDSRYNDGTLLVSRILKVPKPATSYTSCPNCLITLTSSNSRKHISKCTQVDAKGSRGYFVLGKIVEGRLHKSASDTLRLIVFPVLREDEIVRLIRYDWLIILYGNKLCLRYTPHYQHNVIRARLRLIGRFLYSVKKINSKITELADIYDPIYYATVIDAIKIVARINHLKNTCEVPAVAANLVTHIKQIAQFLELEYILKKNEEGQKNVINFLKVLTTDTPTLINKIARESDAQIKRQKIILLPMTEDITKLLLYLKDEGKKCFSKLSNQYTSSDWLNGLKLIAVHLLVFNRRRVGDVQNILISDFDHSEDIHISAEKEEFNALDSDGKQITKNYKRIKIRGKLNRSVAVILSLELIREINIILSYRENANVPTDNEYLFGLPNNVNDRIRVLNLCAEICRLSVACGAKKPELLRGTGLRKHIAAKCIELDLTENAISDVTGHFGHSDKIHREIYRKPPKSKTIVQISKVLEAVQGDYQDDEVTDAIDEDITDDQSEFLEYQKFSESIHEVPNKIGDRAVLSPEVNESSLVIEASLNETIVKHKKTRWTDDEKKIMLTKFGNYIAKKAVPGFHEIENFRKQHAFLRNRSKQCIKSWISNQLKSLKHIKKRPIVTQCKKVNLDLKRFKQKLSDNCVKCFIRIEIRLFLHYNH